MFVPVLHCVRLATFPKVYSASCSRSALTPASLLPLTRLSGLDNECVEGPLMSRVISCWFVPELWVLSVQVVNVSAWVASGFSSFALTTRKHGVWLIGSAKLPWVWMYCMYKWHLAIDQYQCPVFLGLPFLEKHIVLCFTLIQISHCHSPNYAFAIKLLIACQWSIKKIFMKRFTSI